jgi:hypothetical protein
MDFFSYKEFINSVALSNGIGSDLLNMKTSEEKRKH